MADSIEELLRQVLAAAGDRVSQATALRFSRRLLRPWEDRLARPTLGPEAAARDYQSASVRNPGPTHHTVPQALASGVGWRQLRAEPAWVDDAADQVEAASPGHGAAPARCAAQVWRRPLASSRISSRCESLGPAQARGRRK
jgi:hypothetical protein